ncbi:hypothetical protein [Pseudomonas indica]|uniref:hypothetical protein n=1 Tax=Pseudomonas indica TaxID=137658 RepID=UPI000BABC2ED|nr:hypothetical protein [Pseudomonas indica]MBU3059700.1 hypothetical protein [Pseudomonas indica]PAU54989.1 hypothetical protein BZL42_19340 [Pseudomonas indica]
MKNKVRACAINLCVHSAAFTLLIGLNDIAHRLYKAWIGDFGSRGIASGSVTLLVILLFIGFNVLAAIIPLKAVKISLGVAFVLTTAWFLFPYHPLRAAFYCAAGGLLTFAAIFIASELNSLSANSATREHVKCT